MNALEQALTDIAEKLHSGHSALVTPRDILTWYGGQRRGYWVNLEIGKILTQAGLYTSPDFANAYIDEPIEVHLLKDIGDYEAIEDVDIAAEIMALDEEVFNKNIPVAYVSGSIADPAYRIGKLSSAHQGIVAVSPDDSLQCVTTIMMLNDYSQVPVMTGERTVLGVITWGSISKKLIFAGGEFAVRHCMEKAVEVSIETSIFAVVEIVGRSGYVLVRDATNKITGIVTSSDLGLQFKLLGEPFLVLSEIENYVRQLIDGRFTLEHLAEIRDPSDERPIETVADLTLGEYVRLLQNPDRWDQMGLVVDRKTFVGHLDEVRKIRNEIMHFDPDGIAPGQLDSLRAAARYLRELHELGVLTVSVA